MKNLRKVLAVMLALMLVLGTALPVMAATPSEISTYAANLYNLGLYAGVDASGYVPALDNSLTREQAFVLFAKIMGKAARAADVDDDDIEAYLDDVFTDADQFSEWAKPFATVLIMDKDISGRGDFTMGPQDIIKGNELAVLMLKALKIPVDYNTSVYACVTLWNKGIITFSESAGLNDAFLTRGDAITIFWKTIANGKINGGDYVAKALCDAGVMSEASARAVGLLDTYDTATAAENATAATEAAEAAVTALQAAAYATEADYAAYETLLADAEAKIAAAPAATRAAFTARVNVKKELVASALAAQVSAAELAVDAYTEIDEVATVEASLAAIALKEAAIAKVNAIMDASLRADYLEEIDETREDLEATVLLDLTSEESSVLGDGISEIVINLALKDAFGNVLTDAPATTVELSVDDFGAVSSKEITLYDGVGSVLFAGAALEDDDDETAVITASVDDDFAEAEDTLEIDVTQAPAYNNELVKASMPKNKTDRIILTFKNAVDLDEELEFGPESDIDYDDIAYDDDEDEYLIAADPTSDKNIILFLDEGVDFDNGEKVTIQVGEKEVEFKIDDSQKPYITGVAINEDNYREVVVTFSEPILLTGSESAFLNGSEEADDYETDGNDLILTFADYIEDGNYVVTVAAGSVQDFSISDNTNAAQSKSFTVEEPDFELEAEAKAYSPVLFALELGSDCFVDAASIKVQKYDYDNGEWDDLVLDTDYEFITEIEVDEATDEVVMQFIDTLSDDDAIFEGVLANHFNKKFRVFVEEEGLQDEATGLVNEDDLKLELTDDAITEEDEKDPEVKSFSVKEKSGKYEITVKFSEPIDADELVVDIFEKDDDEDPVKSLGSGVSAKWNDKRMEAKFTVTGLENDTDYYAVIGSFKDDVGNEVDDDEYESSTFKTKKASTPDFEISASIAGNVITVTFSKDIAVTENNITNALYLGNYRYVIDGVCYYFDADGEDAEDSDDDTTIAMNALDEIEITVPADLADDIDGIIVSEFLTAADGSEFEDLEARSADLD